ncbi:hypothetical protein A6R68_13009 [Neotoma lepida]|uniref:WAPL domain-containing protein n=1 Tax=Neotoma lepida TaxID=56216 RepID=A0A1A6H3M5_NEOLE|nr:hypothetical protein A6R68_13009 [Neotoma lepida]
MRFKWEDSPFPFPNIKSLCTSLKSRLGFGLRQRPRDRKTLRCEPSFPFLVRTVVCNVTIQDTMERSMDEFTASTPADLGEAGRLRKKADIATSKTTTRFRPSNTKSKKDVKLEFFGFEDHDETGGDEGGSGSSNYKIKYFGFDDLSESEEEDDDDCQVERKTNKKRTKTAPSPSLQPPPESSDNSQDSQPSTNSAENLDFTEDLPGVPESVKKPINKQGDKSKENTRKIFSGPKRLYTVVQHVKHFNDVVEFGENQEFTDDIEYLLSGLKSTQPLNTRCLRASLDLMIRLLELEQDASSAKLLNEKDMNKIKEKIRRLCETVHNKHLDLENITVPKYLPQEQRFDIRVLLFLERERAAQLAESKTDELIKDAPTTQHDKSGEWQETSGEIQWVSTEKTDGTEEKQKEEEDEELDLNKGMFISSSIFIVFSRALAKC